MEIHLISSLTPDDERRLAPAMLAAIGRVLDRLPVTYSVRLETATGNAIQHNRTVPPATGYIPEDGFDDGVREPAVVHASPARSILDRD